MEEELALALLLVSMATKMKKKKKSRIWVKEWMQKFGTNGHFENVYREWHLTDPDFYRAQLRMYPEDFGQLLRGVDPYIRKQDTVLRLAVTVEKRLTVTLKFLVTGKYIFKIYIQFGFLYHFNFRC